MPLDYNAIAAWSALIASATAIVALWAESRRSRFSQGIDLLLKLSDEFRSDAMLPIRRAAAKALRRTEDKGDVDEILDFFEMVGLLTRRGALDEKLVWHTFFYWIHRYFLASSSYITALQSQDSTVWQDLVSLHMRLVDIEKRQRRCSDVELALDQEELSRFLQEEASI